MVKLRKSVWQQIYENKINDDNVILYEGICKTCKKKFTFFVDNQYDKALFWTKDDEKIFYDFFKNLNIYGSIRIIYLIDKNKFDNVWKNLNKTKISSTNIIFASNDFSSIINKYDLRKDNKIFFIDKDILETKFEEKYPCILAEKNIYEMASKWRHFKLYSDHNTYFKLFENIGVKNG